MTTKIVKNDEITYYRDRWRCKSTPPAFFHFLVISKCIETCENRVKLRKRIKNKQKNKQKKSKQHTNSKCWNCQPTLHVPPYSHSIQMHPNTLKSPKITKKNGKSAKND